MLLCHTLSIGILRQKLPCCALNQVRIWNLKTDANFVLTVDSDDGGGAGGGGGGATLEGVQFITCLSYCSARRLVAAGTNSGAVVMWRNTVQDRFDDDDGWKSLPASSAGSAVRGLSWGAAGEVCALSTVRQVFFLHEQERAVSFYGGAAATQVTPTAVQIAFSDREKAPSKLVTNVSIEQIKLGEGT